MLQGAEMEQRLVRIYRGSRGAEATIGDLGGGVELL